jgi:hypothetical protein
MIYEVQSIAEGFFDPTAKTDSRFSGSLDECKTYLEKIKEELTKKRAFYGAFTDDLTLEIRKKEDHEPTLEKYIIVNLFK